MSRINSDRIIWTENALQELERLFGTTELEIEELEEGLGGLDFPWPITIKSLKAEGDPDGSTYTTLTIGFDEIPGATGYEVRYALYKDEYPSISDTISIAARGGSTGIEYWNGTLSSPITESDRCIILTGDTSNDAPTGLFANWERVYSYAGLHSYDIAVWMGSGVGTGTLGMNCNTNTGFGVYGNHSVGYIFRDAGRMEIIQDTYTRYSGGSSPFSAAAITASKSRIFIGAALGKSGFLAHCTPSDTTLPVVTGVGSYNYVKAGDGAADLYGRGIAAVCGPIRLDTNVDSSFTMEYDPGAVGGAAINLVFSYAGVE